MIEKLGRKKERENVQCIYIDVCLFLLSTVTTTTRVELVNMMQ